MRVQCTCETCGTSFWRYASQLRGLKYCSKVCQLETPLSTVRLSEDGLSAQVPLCARDRSVRAYAIIDAVDLPRVCDRRWSLDSNGYVQGYSPLDGHIRLHRFILGLKRGNPLEGDHINHNRLDCRRANLRITTKAGNMQNFPAIPSTSSKYRGVSWSEGRKKWVAAIQVNGKTVTLGRFAKETDAAEAARLARQRLMPFAVD